LNRVAVLILLAVVAAAAMVVLPFVGSYRTSLGAIWEGDQASWVLWQLRVPRVLTAFAAGAGLAISGMAFQAVFRNPLAEPFTLGVASGASLGATLYVYLGLLFTPLKILDISGASLFAFVGAVLAILLVYGLTQVRRGFSNATLLLAGVAINFLFASLILLLQYVSDFTQSYLILRALMGGLNHVVSFNDLLTLVPFVATGTAIAAFLTHEMNLLATGEDLAASRGVEVARVKLLLFFSVSLMVGAIVAVCGPIGFVGLMAPHTCRLLLGADHRYLTPATFLFGGTFLTVCDALARSLLNVTELPVGILTSLLGGPFFLWLLLWRSSDIDR
jgi:iron complex transport system permease protein